VTRNSFDLTDLETTISTRFFTHPLEKEIVENVTKENLRKIIGGFSFLHSAG
jgi:hypothetical protein